MEDEWVKAKSWTWKSDIKYHLWVCYLVPKYLFKWIFNIDFTRKLFDFSEVVSFAKGSADVRAGRLYEWRI